MYVLNSRATDSAGNGVSRSPLPTGSTRPTRTPPRSPAGRPSGDDRKPKWGFRGESGAHVRVPPAARRRPGQGLALVRQPAGLRPRRREAGHLHVLRARDRRRRQHRLGGQRRVRAARLEQQRLGAVAARARAAARAPATAADPGAAARRPRPRIQRRPRPLRRHPRRLRPRSSPTRTIPRTPVTVTMPVRAATSKGGRRCGRQGRPRSQGRPGAKGGPGAAAGRLRQWGRRRLRRGQEARGAHAEVLRGSDRRCGRIGDQGGRRDRRGAGEDRVPGGPDLRGRGFMGPAGPDRPQRSEACVGARFCRSRPEFRPPRDALAAED